MDITEGHAFLATYSYSTQSHRFSGTSDVGDLSVVNGSGSWHTLFGQGSAQLDSVQIVDDEPGVLSHAFLVFDLLGSSTGEWWAFVNLRDPEGPNSPEDLFTTDYRDIRMSLNSYLILDTHTVPLPSTWPLVLVCVTLVVLRVSYKAKP